MMKSSDQVRIQQAFTQQAPRPLAGKTADFTRMADVSTSEQCSQEINRKNLRLISQSVKEPLLSASECEGIRVVF